VEPWTGTQSAFAVKAFYKNGESFVIAQREFRREFVIHRIRAVTSAHATKTWVRNFEATGSTPKKKGGSAKSVERWLQTARVTPSDTEWRRAERCGFLKWRFSLPQCSRFHSKSTLCFSPRLHCN
jgi:hypothetical protein